VRDGRDHELPADEMMLQAGDELLFAGTRAAKAAQNLTLDNRNVLDYVLTGHDAPGWLWREPIREGCGARYDAALAAPSVGTPPRVSSRILVSARGRRG
jgi:voltage-gated potassium channel